MQETTIDSMLNADLTSVDTSFPVLEAGVYQCTIAECAPGETKENKKPVLNLKLSTLTEAKVVGGGTRSAGFTLRDMVSLTATERYNPKQRLAQIKLAAFGTQEGPFGDPAQYVGRPVTVRVKVESSEEFGNQNRVAAYVKQN